ncbi:MAG: lipoxygenase [Oscillatoriales cyanobacterium]|nr:MAG: lipoxygenase [Oscillatoriales cyanobacterium]TAE05707.1 MAG: lipoxygenase [Oscillatoriales cyanobacterium]
MPLSSETPNSHSDKTTLINTLLTLYKFVKLAFRLRPFGEYNYNYDYIPSLAMTTSPRLPVPVINLNIPSQELPSKEWVMLVVQKITILSANKARNFNNDIPSFSVGPSTENSSLFDEKMQVLKDIEQEIKSVDSKEYLTNIAWKIASAANQITEELSPGGVSFSVGGSESVEDSEIEQQLREIDEQFANAYQSSETSETLDFSVGSDLEDTSGESLDLAFKEIIKENIKLLELESEPSSNVDFSTEFKDFPSMEDYNKLFVDIRLPQISQRFQEDLIFAYMRVAGPNPLMLQQLSEQNKPLQITNEKYQQIIEKFEFSDSLEAALQEGRLYQADYSMLKDMAQGSFPNNVKKYPAAPLALFAVPPVNSSSRSLIPVAIQCQHPSVSENPPVFTPLDGDNWMVAKTIVQMADSNYHELVSHLGRTHLFVEPFVLATKRKLPADHKLRILLEPHFEGTILINYGAHKTLIANGGKVDQLLASTIEDDRVIAVEGAKSYLHSFNDVMFPKTLTKHGVGNSAQLPDYPYRDDGRLIWDAIHTWVGSYLSIYYTSDHQLLEDKALQNWAQELVSDQGGRLKNFGEDASGAIKTLNYLIDAVSSVIFTASAQHAAVNFPQSELMSYTPAFPFAIYSPAPTSSEKQENFISMLPSLDRSQTQIGVTYLLGSVYYTQLGQYNKGHFKDAKVWLHLGEFQNQLRDIEIEISKKNRSRLMPYKFLLPSQIPQSINI